ncbi:PREDICTED: snRNA-activating protein complex subunit 4 [Papilio xuthus]|uniref:snRNA-activating protein complex subunit 4 n=1 Tax=Papilio xuthus TaxID=66420 RepID=A0AAJ6Z520_PAPXU|nr:PREDICTED: snRNA-activating protein complex subunit 4 [Papilio xuthus]
MSFRDFNFDHSDIDVEVQDLQELSAVLDCIGPSSIASTSQIISPSINHDTVEPDYSKIDEALSLNKLADEKLRGLEKILMLRLNECNHKLKSIESKYKRNKFFDKNETFRYVSCGKPYFKDKSNFTPPHNKDTITMLNNGMYNFSTISPVPGWTVRDKSQFLTMIHRVSLDMLKKKVEAKITDLNREKKIKPSIKIDRKIETLRHEIVLINKMTLKQSALPIGEEYDWESIAERLNNRHSAQEYEALWKLFLHPDINKNAWSKNEHTSLQKIAFNNNFQNWDDIAAKLGTKRTGYQCFVYFRTNMNNTFTGQKWTKEEEEYLKRLIDYYREDKYIPWGKVATSMENRTKIQVYNKYNRLTEQRKGRFLPEEDTVILTCADKFGLDFKRMTNYLPGRSLGQLRIRYQILAKQRISTVWTVEEDNKLLQLLANKKTPTVYSDLTQYFPGKDRMHIRSRHMTLLKWMKLHPHSDVSRAPRRAARRLGHGPPSDNNLHKAIEDLKNRIKSEVEERKCKKITIKSPESVIEDGIMATLVNQITKIEEAKKLEQSQNEVLEFLEDIVVSPQVLNATNIKKLLVLFKSKLNKSKLINCEYSKKFPDLIEGHREVCLVKKKSYSKKECEKVVVKKIPDIFGTNTLDNLEYVLPPHYATIVGCRQLMAWVSESKKNRECDINLNALIRKNCLLKEHFFQLLERFNSLFLWPMLLSNESPHLNKAVENIFNTSTPILSISDSTEKNAISNSVVDEFPNLTNNHTELEELNSHKDKLKSLDNTCTEKSI